LFETIFMVKFRTIVLLIIAVVLIPLAAFNFDVPLNDMQVRVLKQVTGIMLVIALSCFMVAELTRNCSQVDKLWSINPMIYSWFITASFGFDTRMVLMSLLVSIWGIRLTYNFNRRGGYSWKFWTGEEDYRWNVVRKNPALRGRLRWGLFNLFFISLYQNALILLFTLPVLVASNGMDTPLNWIDVAAAAGMLAFVLIETLADQQQYIFQTEKQRRIKSNEPLGTYAAGFISTGLWSKVRHPNYASEQAIWLSFYLFSVAATGRWFNWSLAGAVLLMILFQSSAEFSEGISASKYHGYKAYQKRVSRFFPKLF
jgi:steroid 5-alpha reductase family enzyme